MVGWVPSEQPKVLGSLQLRGARVELRLTLWQDAFAYPKTVLSIVRGGGSWLGQAALQAHR
eukprot:3238638-Lingulodinium_polyedra.AAC.1